MISVSSSASFQRVHAPLPQCIHCCAVGSTSRNFVKTYKVCPLNVKPSENAAALWYNLYIYRQYGIGTISQSSSVSGNY